MKKLSIKDLNRKRGLNPVLKDISESLKDPSKFDEIETKILNITKVEHSHKTVKEFVKCLECSSKFEEKRNLLKEYGFKNYNQYLMWKKVQIIIKNKQNFQIR